MFDITYECKDCKTMLLVDLDNERIYCRKCKYEEDLRFGKIIKTMIKLGIIELENIKCNKGFFEKYNL